MRTLFGLALAGALALGITSDAKAQLAISVGNPYGLGYGLGGYGGYGGYSTYGVAPLTSVYSSGYSGIGTGVVGVPAYGIGAPGYGIGAPGYGVGVAPLYRGYSYGYGVTPYYGGYRNVYRGGGFYRPFYGRRW